MEDATLGIDLSCQRTGMAKITFSIRFLHSKVLESMSVSSALRLSVG